MHCMYVLRFPGRGPIRVCRCLRLSGPVTAPARSSMRHEPTACGSGPVTALLWSTALVQSQRATASLHRAAAGPAPRRAGSPGRERTRRGTGSGSQLRRLFGPPGQTSQPAGSDSRPGPRRRTMGQTPPKIGNKSKTQLHNIPPTMDQNMREMFKVP